MQDIKYLTPEFAVSPQITAAQLEKLKAAGFSTVICNRPDHEEPGQPTFAEIKAAAEAAGLEAHHIPIKPGQATRGDVVAFDTAVTTAEGKVLAYCRSGGRAQSLFAATKG
jgi:sulfide:quinone oxidoreductase